DVDRIFAEIRALPAGATPPPVPWIISLPADGAATKLDIDDEATRQRAYRRGTYSDFALAPPPGKEFDTVEFACDIEQFNPRMGGQFSCSVATAVPPGGRKHLGSIGWPREKRRASEVGRETVTQGFVVPAGAGLVHMQIGTSARKEFVVHSVVVKATYRAITNNPPPICADAWAQMELLPASGRLTWGPKVLANATAISGLAPGRETLRFSAPGDTRTIEMPFQVTPGGRCGLFVNLDSPFRWRQIELAIGGDRGVSDPNLSVQRLGKEFVAVWCNPAGKLLSARSGDLAAWSPPEVLPFGAVFSNIAPATYLAADGTMWLAYFSNRLSPMETGSGGYHLWLTSTPDGKAWAPPRKIDVQTVDGWPLNPPVMLTDQAGGTWLFCRNFAGSVAAGETLDKLTALQPLARAKRGEKVLNMWNFQVAREGADGFRMVFDDFGAGIYTMVSRKGLAWGDPRPLVTEPPGTADNAAGQIAHVCLIRDQGRAMLLYSWRGGSYLTPVDPDGPAVVAGQGVKIASSLVPVVGRTPIEHEGRLFFIAGDSATWLLEVDLKTLLAVPASRPSPGAGIRN
ncbi:MAG: hypothetical protein NTV86_23620, partial [Planctomycetota bacterium]|nr:hypothetical protein [Planctomycetota bacterium]